MTADAEREIAQWVSGRTGELRVAVECHTCFDWLMPAMDEFREHWPEVELDLISGFHTEAMAMVEQGLADFAVIHDKPPRRAGIATEHLFTYETLAIMSPKHRYAEKGIFAAQGLRYGSPHPAIPSTTRCWTWCAISWHPRASSRSGAMPN